MLYAKYIGCSKSIRTTTAVIPTLINSLQRWTNPLVTRCTYSSGFSIAENTCGSQFFILTKIAASYFILWFPHRQMCSFPGRFLFWEVKKTTPCMVVEYGDCCMCGTSCLAKKCCTIWAQCAGALSRWICQSPDDHFSARLRRIESRRRRRTCK